MKTTIKEVAKKVRQEIKGIKSLAEKKKALIKAANEFIMKQCPVCGTSLKIKK